MGDPYIRCEDCGAPATIADENDNWLCEDCFIENVENGEYEC